MKLPMELIPKLIRVFTYLQASDLPILSLAPDMEGIQVTLQGPVSTTKVCILFDGNYVIAVDEPASILIEPHREKLRALLMEE